MTEPKHVLTGKVREIYEADDTLYVVATDRISAFDVVFAEPIPDRGRVLTLMSAFWMEMLADIVPNHLVEVGLEPIHSLPAEAGDPDWLAGRTTRVRKATMYPIECIVRGYLYGSAWREYQTTGRATGLELPAGMRLAERLPEPTFTPSTKALRGHDENIDLATARGLVGDVVDEIAAISIRLYETAAAYAVERGVIIADTKFEFGAVDGRLTLCDEAFTPDSSRFWYTSDWEPGTDPPALDKQFLRRFLDTLDWDKTPPPPALPAEVVTATRARYIEAYEELTAHRFPW
ncbi:MAG: phosphoribosylaminoimidazolesuccinocarboxamide synthase [Acidimicrobiia bacterium]|nr:phosphoribosylaminoimidazolesuccinocarboxamide synthase [Acidimicrobiia bacterium]